MRLRTRATALPHSQVLETITKSPKRWPWLLKYVRFNVDINLQSYYVR